MIARRALLLSSATLAAACTGLPRGLEAVRFEPERYLGAWYEIARLEQSFQRGLTNVTATYTALPDGRIGVVNRGIRPDGTISEAQGVARFLGARDVASLAVRFSGPFEGGYNVIRLDPEYRIALVAGPDRSFLWLLSRTPTLPEPVVQDWLEFARARGFDTAAMIRTPQTPRTG
jgi:apolipoprotein D and lipocalin family protein